MLFLTKESKKLSIMDDGLSLDKFRKTSLTNQRRSSECAAKFMTGQILSSLLISWKFRYSRSQRVISTEESLCSITFSR